jgi:hypothetical protein
MPNVSAWVAAIVVGVLLLGFILWTWIWFVQWAVEVDLPFR